MPESAEHRAQDAQCHLAWEGKRMSDQAGEGRTITVRHVVIAVVAILVVVFAFMNTNSVELSLFGWNVKIQLWLLIIVVYVLGVFTGSWARKGARYMRGKDK